MALSISKIKPISKKKLTLPFFKRYVASKLIISARDGWHPKMFAAPLFWLIWFVSIILLFVTLLLNSHGSSHYLSVTSHTSSFCASGCNCSASYSEQHEGVVNISLNYFVRIKSWLIVNTFSKYCCAYLQGFLFPKSLFLPPPPPHFFPKQILKPQQLLSFPNPLEKLMTAL